jgi:hypothetical protein
MNRQNKNFARPEEMNAAIELLKRRTLNLNPGAFDVQDLPFIPDELIRAILQFPQFTVRFLTALRDARIPNEQYAEAGRRFEPNYACSLVQENLQGVDPRDRDKVIDAINKAMVAIGIFGALATLACFVLAEICAELGLIPLTIFLIVAGFFVILATAAIELILVIVLQIIGSYLQNGQVGVLPIDKSAITAK